MSLDDILNLPLKRFWFLANQVDRIRAEEDMRQLQLLACAQSSEGFESAVESLRTQMGQIYVWKPEPATLEFQIDATTGSDPTFDRAGLQRLRALSG